MIRIASLTLAAVSPLILTACGPKPADAAASSDVKTLGNEQAAVLGAIGALGGGRSNPQMQAFIANLSRVSDELVTVKDEASARAIGQKLAPVFAEMEKQAAEIDKMNESERAAAAMAAAPELMKIGMKMSEFAMKNPELMEIIDQELQKMPELGN